MTRLKSILLLFIMGIIIFPWQMICLEHPFGHEHHHHNGSSPCEIRREISWQPGAHLFPPMDCKNTISKIDKISLPQVEKIVPSFQTFALLVVLFDLPYLFSKKETPVLFPTEPNCRSATLISDNPLRGPPLV